ncbi:hypothetical protein ACHHYP_04193 [Achlya hypogyna]|uniref:Uncharacterized protein n=1 Tax=Achlya hypogyna TaxID=1202772 RepID=A0A1V9Z283_ACHHY|nr:hypothetical protein ACHHYP_04193 [Achlya hypogyna]
MAVRRSLAAVVAAAIATAAGDAGHDIAHPLAIDDNLTLILAIVLGVLGLCLIAGLVLLCYKRRRRNPRQCPSNETYFKTTGLTSEDGYSYARAPYNMDTYPIQLSEYNQPSTATPEMGQDMYYASSNASPIVPGNYSRKIGQRPRPASFAGSGVSEDSSIVSERDSEAEWTTKLIKLHHQSTSSASSSSAASSPSSQAGIILIHDRPSDIRYGDSLFSQPSLGHTFARGSNAFRVSSFSYDLSPSILDTNGSTVIMETSSQASRESYDI